MSESITHSFYILTDPASDTWLDVTADVLHRGRSWSHGIMSSAPLDRIASVGSATFMLRNDSVSGTEYRYTPGHVNCISGFSVKTKVKIVAGWSGNTKTVFLGWIPPDGIVQPTASNQANIVSVTAFDYIYTLLNHTVSLAAIGTNKTLGNVATDLLALLEVQPSRVDKGNYSETFASTNETVRENTSVYAELNKAVLSEMGFAYVKYEPNSTANDILMIEGQTDRSGVSAYDTVDPGDGEIVQHLTDESGNIITTEGDDHIILDYVTTFDSIPGIMQFSVTNGAHFTNRVLGKCYPKKLGATTEIYRLNSPLSLKAGETRTNLRVSYLVEAGYVSVAADDVAIKGTPAMFVNSNGTGANLSAYLTVTGTFGAADASLTLENTGATDGYVTSLVLEGTPIYIGDTISQVVEIATEGSEYYGHIETVLDQKYQTDPEHNFDQISILATKYSERINTVQDITFCANASNILAGLYMMNDIGSKIPIVYAGGNIDEDYFIHGIEVWSEGNATLCKFTLKPASYDSFNFWAIESLGYSELGETTVLGIES
jgi:hypothetical protein